MEFTTPTDVRKFVPGQQDALIAEMQAQALRDFQSAAMLADRERAVAALSQGVQARAILDEIVGRRSAQRRGPSAQ